MTPPGGANPHPRVGHKAHLQGRKVLVQGWSNRGSTVRRVGGGSSWHRAHLRAKSLGTLHNLVRRQLLLVCFVIKPALSLSWSSTPVLGAL